MSTCTAHILLNRYACTIQVDSKVKKKEYCSCIRVFRLDAIGAEFQLSSCDTFVKTSASSTSHKVYCAFFFFVHFTMSKEILSDAVNTIDLLQSIYFDKEFEFQRNEDEIAYKILQGCWESDTWPTSFTPPLPSNLEFTIKAPVELQDETDIVHLTFNGQISLISIEDYQLTLPSAANLWLSREDHELFVNVLNNGIQLDASEDRSTWIIEKMQQLQSIAEPYAIAKLQKSKDENAKVKLIEEGGPARFLRDWIWFPMIYTREKVNNKIQMVVPHL
jgi:hypothetical protein